MFEIKAKTAPGSSCHSCNASLAEGAKFCPECGTPVPVSSKCSSCGADLKAEAKFCGECGTPVTNAAPAPAASSGGGDSSIADCATVAQAEYSSGKLEELNKFDTWKNSPTAEGTLLTGLCYFHGVLTEESRSTASMYFKKAAEANHAAGMYYYALTIYPEEAEHEGDLPESNEDGFRWLKKSADMGNREAMSHLGVFYFNASNPTEAFQWRLKAAELGDKWCMCDLGVAYLEGEGVEKNRTLAEQWLRKADALGDTDADWHLEENFS